MDKLLFGAAYYLEYMPADRLEQDFIMMKAANINVIRIAESTWSTLEPKKGVYDFSFIDKVLDFAEREGMMVIVGTPTYAIPSWMEKEDANVMVVSKSGQSVYGRRQIMDITNDTFLFHVKNIIETLMLHVKDKNCIIGYQIDNETKHYGNEGVQIQKMFLSYLKEKFKTTEELNRVFGLAYWSNSIASWDDFFDMRGCIHAGLSCEFEKFKRSIAAQYLKLQSEIVQKHLKEGQFITHNFDFEWKKFGADIAQDGYSYGVQPDINHLEASEAVTIAGTDIYHPTQDELTGAEISFGGDIIRNLKQKEYLVLECQAQAFKYWTPYKGQLRLHAYSHLASGATGVMYWNWHSIHDGYETYWKGLLSHDLKSNPTYEEACIIGKEFKEHGKENLCIQKKNKVAMIVDNHSLSALKWFPIDCDLSYNDVFRWMYDCLFELNIECDVIDVNAMKNKDMSQYKVVITPALYSICENDIQILKQYVKNGGRLISSFKSFVADEFLSVYANDLPALMTDCFGMSYNQHTIPGKAKVNGYEAAYLAELLVQGEATTLAKYEHKYWGSYSAITEHTFGAGKAYYIGTFLPKAALKELYQKIAKEAGILESYHEEVKWPVIIKNGKNQKNEVLHYVLHYSEDEGELRNSFGQVEDILSGHIYQSEEIIPLTDWAVVILKEL